MKKIFTLIATALFAIGVQAEDVKVTWQMGENTTGAADPTTAASDIKYTVGSGLTENESTATCDDVVFTKLDQNTGSNKGANNAHDTNVGLGKYIDFTFTPVGGEFTPTNVSFDFIKIGTGDPTIDVDVIDAAGNTIAVATNVTIRKSSESSPSISHSFEVSGAEGGTGAVTLRIIVGKLASGKAVGVANVNIEGTLVSADAPVLSATSELNFNVNPYTPELTATSTISLVGKNLTDGTYDTPVPAEEQITIAPATFTVTDGVVNQEFTVTYKPTSSVTDGVTKVFFTVGDLDAATTINYSARLEKYEQATVSEKKTWDWTKLTETIELTEETAPSIKDEFVFLELEDQVKFGEFDAQSIVLSNTQFPVRSKKLQNGTIKIMTTVDGVITVTFSDTGSSGTDPVKRYIKVNDTVTEYYTQRTGSSNDQKTTGEIPCEAGEIAICGWDVDAEVNVPLCIYTLTFEPKDITTAITSVAAEANDGAIYNLAGQRVNNAVKGIFIQNGKKFVVK